MDESLLLGLYTADGMQKVDGLAIQGIGIPGGHLMERAGLAVATEILERYDPEEAVVFAGKGNNGGDGFVVARELFDAGCEVTVFLLAAPEEYKGDAKLNLEILDRLGIDVRPATDEGGALAEDTMVLTEMADVVVDAVFGTGFTGAAKGPAAAAIELMNEAPGAVVSVDIMSGVGASTGSVHGPAVFADLTVTLHAAKVGHFVTPGGAFSGEVVIAPIGIPSLCDQDPDVWLLTDDGGGRADRPQERARPQAVGGHRARRRRVEGHGGRRPHGRVRGPQGRRRPGARRAARRRRRAEALRRGHHRHGAGRGRPVRHRRPVGALRAGRRAQGGGRRPRLRPHRRRPGARQGAHRPRRAAAPRRRRPVRARHQARTAGRAHARPPSSRRTRASWAA